MPHILTAAEFAESLGQTAVTAQLVSALEDAEALFEMATNRTDAPFGAGQTGRTEVHDGTGQSELYLDYPVSVLTSVKLGYDPAIPDDTIAVNDQTVLNWKVGSHRLRRIGGRFGAYGQPNYVQVVYTTQTDIPEAVRAAIKAGGAYVFTSIGTADVQSETFGPWSATYSAGGTTAALMALPAWADAVSAYKRWAVR